MGSEEAVDGRRARAERSREAVVDAILALLREGNPRPGAAEIAERAGVSLRSVFRHFDDLETLYAVAVERNTEQIGPLFVFVSPPPAPGEVVASTAARIDALAAQRARLFEELRPVRVVAERLRDSSPTLDSGLERSRRLLRSQLQDVFAPELDDLAPADRRELLDALEGVAGFAVWNQFRSDQGLSVPRAQAALRRVLHALLDPRERP